MLLRRVCTPVIQLQPFARGHIVGLREAGWTYRRIAAHVGHNLSVECRCFQQWSVVHSHSCTPGFGRPCSTDTLCEQRWPPKQQPGKKLGHMLHLLCHARSRTQIMCASGQATTYTKTPPSMATLLS